MKAIVAIITFVISFGNFTQSKKIDVLINEVENSDVMILDDGLKIKNNTVEDLIKIGKPANKKLLKVLDDPTKGIVAHPILSEIWKDSWGEARCGDAKRNANEKEFIIYNGLKIFVNDRMPFASALDLKENKRSWEKYF